MPLKAGRLGRKVVLLSKRVMHASCPGQARSPPVSVSFPSLPLHIGVCGGVLLLTLLFATPLFQHLSKNTQGAIIIVGVLGLFDLRAGAFLWRVSSKHWGLAARSQPGSSCVAIRSSVHFPVIHLSLGTAGRLIRAAVRLYASECSPVQRSTCCTFPSPFHTTCRSTDLTLRSGWWPCWPQPSWGWLKALQWLCSWLWAWSSGKPPSLAWVSSRTMWSGG